MASEMVERVARALYEIQPDTDDDDNVIPWAAYESGDYRDAYINAAVVAIEALREPTPAMISAIHGALKAHIDAVPDEERRAMMKQGRAGYIVDKNTKARIRYTAAIDQALAQRGKEG